MARLEDIRNGALVAGLMPSRPVHVVSTEWIGNEALNVIFRDPQGSVSETTLYREDEHRLNVEEAGRLWSFDADGGLLRLVTEANRIKLAHYFDPYLAIHTSLVEPLPHQITAVYGEMLPRQPLRFLLADDPGAGKTIMAGLLMKELIARGDLERCLVVAPGSLVEQWQDELGEKFDLEFDILTRDMIETSRSGNPFNDRNKLIARLDVLARNDDLQDKLLRSNEWDVIVCDEAHRMSASYFGGEVKYTKRYLVGQKLGQICRHLLLMSATPHNGKEEDFQLFMALLDGDRFEGRFRDGVHYADTEDMMRRLTKEELLKFDGRPLFPERKAYTVKYDLSDEEAALYGAVTEYVRTEMNRVQRFAEGDGKKKNNVGFALQILQRRLASSPAAIYHSLKRRRERLENELAEARLISRGRRGSFSSDETLLNDDLLGNIEEYGQDEVDDLEDLIATSVTTAETVEQLEIEVETLKGLEQMASKVLRSGKDTKWRQLDQILDDGLMVDEDGSRRKLIVFTEPKDTLNYLAEKISGRLGKPDAVEVIHGGVKREERRKVIERFMQDRDLLVLIANDAAGEGVNLQRGHLMVNYDLPWNPNKIEQRFGRIHRIGQTEVCHLWNLVAADTREGAVYGRLLEKLETARAALGGRVYDVLGELFEGTALKDLLFEAIQYGEQEEVKARLFETIDGAVDQQNLLDLLKRRALTNDAMPVAAVEELRVEMERAGAQRLQPHHIQSFFVEAFQHLGGRMRAREEGRFEITHVPVRVRDRDRLIGTAAPLQKKFERICFEKDRIHQQPVAEFVCPGHPLLEAVISLVREQHDHLMKQGAVLVDETDEGEEVSAVFLMEHTIQDGRATSAGSPHVVSQKLQFAAINEHGEVSNAGIAPHLNLRPATSDEIELVRSELNADWLSSDLEGSAARFATVEMAQSHLKEVKNRRQPEIEKVEREVKARLSKEINYWDSRAFELKEQEKAGRKTRLNWENAQRRAEDLAERMKRRLELLEKEKFISSQPPQIRGGMVVVPQGLLNARMPEAEAISPPPHLSDSADNRKEIERKAMEAVMAAEEALGNIAVDVSAQKVGYDIEAFDPDAKRMRFIEVKGRIEGADTIMVTRNEVITSLHKPDDYILAIVPVANGFASQPHYVRNGSAPSEYSDPREFFSRTYLTDGLSTLLVGAAKRLSENGGDPIVELQTNFGGGKTHSMLALYHMVGEADAKDLPGLDQLLEENGLTVPDTINRAVLVGTSRGPQDVLTVKGGTKVRTTWGDMAWQLGGKEAYALVAENDKMGIAPGSEILEKLFKSCAPCLILIDEWVAYLRQIYKTEGLPSGTFDANLSFVQSLTEAVKASPGTLLVASLPASQIEVGGEGGQEALMRLKQTFSRVENPWRPASQEESYEIVRRRLFKAIPGDRFHHRDNTLKQYAKLYRDNQSDFPQGCSDEDYRRKLEKAYPIHPELFDRLYVDWGSIEKFQRTRGVLRLMAQVIHELWMANDPSVMIMPGNVAVSSQRIEPELMHYLDTNWQSIIAGDVDGASSTPYKIDQSAPNLNKFSATRRVARAVFMGSAPTHQEQNKGLDDKHINLGVVQPGERPATFGDALRRLSNHAKFLHSDLGRYWYSTAASLNRLASDRAGQFDDELILTTIDKHLAAYINGLADRGHFDAVQATPQSSADVPDEAGGVRAVVLGIKHPHTTGKDASDALAEVKDILFQRGSTPRVYRNMLVFLAADARNLDNLKSAVRLYLAWGEIVNDTERLDLTQSDAAMAKAKLDEAKETLAARLRETWCWLIYPSQENAQEEMELNAGKVSAQDNVLSRASKKLIGEEGLLAELGPARLDRDLEKYIWNDKPHISLKELWEYLNRYTYLPRLKDQAVLIRTVQTAVSGTVPGPFAYAERWDEAGGTYLGLVIEATPNAQVVIDDDSVIIRPEVAEPHRPKPAEPGQPEPEEGDDDVPDQPTEDEPAPAPDPALPTRFIGTVMISPERPARDMHQIVEGVIEQLTTISGAEVSLKLEIDAEVPDGLDRGKVRTVLENANTLGFIDKEFK